MGTKALATPKQKYQLLVSRSQTFQFEVDAKSPEEACKLLQKQLSAEDIHYYEHKREPVFSSWNVPSEPREEWAIMNTIQTKNSDSLQVQAWNGKQFLPIGDAEPGDSIEQAFRKIFDPKRRKANKKKTVKHS